MQANQAQICSCLNKYMELIKEQIFSQFVQTLKTAKEDKEELESIKEEVKSATSDNAQAIATEPNQPNITPHQNQAATCQQVDSAQPQQQGDPQNKIAEKPMASEQADSTQLIQKQAEYQAKTVEVHPPQAERAQDKEQAE